MRPLLKAMRDARSGCLIGVFGVGFEDAIFHGRVIEKRKETLHHANLHRRL